MFVFTGVRAILRLGDGDMSASVSILFLAITIWSEMFPFASRVMYTGSCPGLAETQISSQFDNSVLLVFVKFNNYVLGFRP